VDGHDILIPYGQGYEGARRISEGAYGYKLLVLLNIQDDCELIVGYILGGLQESEITMLRRMLARLDKTLGPLREWLKILWMDRGYWGTDLFCELKQDYGIDFVSRVRDEKLDLNGGHPTATGGGGPALDQFRGRAAVLRAQGDAEGARDRLTADHFDQRRTSGSSANRGEYRGGPSMSPRRLSDSGQEGEGYFPDRLRHQPGAGEVRSESARILSGPLGNRESGIFAGCRRPGTSTVRQGTASGRFLARLVFVFMTYNARHLFEKQSRHRPDYAEQLRQMRSYGPGISLAGAANVVLTASGFCCTFTARELLKLHKQRLQKAIQRGLVAGRPIEEIMREFDSS